MACILTVDIEDTDSASDYSRGDWTSDFDSSSEHESASSDEKSTSIRSGDLIFSNPFADMIVAVPDDTSLVSPFGNHQQDSGPAETSQTQNADNLSTTATAGGESELSDAQTVVFSIQKRPRTFLGLRLGKMKPVSKTWPKVGDQRLKRASWVSRVLKRTVGKRKSTTW